MRTKIQIKDNLEPQRCLLLPSLQVDFHIIIQLRRCSFKDKQHIIIKAVQLGTLKHRNSTCSSLTWDQISRLIFLKIRAHYRDQWPKVTTTSEIILETLTWVRLPWVNQAKSLVVLDLHLQSAVSKHNRHNSNSISLIKTSFSLMSMPRTLPWNYHKMTWLAFRACTIGLQAEVYTNL